MMTNLLNGAHVANKLFSTIARLRLLLVMFVALTVSANAWGAEVTFSPNELTAVTNSNYSHTKENVTIAVTASTVTTEEFRIFKNQTITITSTGGAITNIKFTCTANNTTKYGPGCLTVDDGEYTYSDKVGTWTGSATEIIFTASTNQVRATEIVVTTVASDPSLTTSTTEIDFSNVAVNSTNTKTFTFSGSNLTANANLSISGTNKDYFSINTETVAPLSGSISDKSITVTYKPIATGEHTATLTISSSGATSKAITLIGNALQEHIVKFFSGGEEVLSKNVLNGSTIGTLPSATSCDQTNFPRFVGWTESTIDGTTTTKPAIITTSTTISSNKEYHAVFADKEESTGSGTTGSTTFAPKGSSKSSPWNDNGSTWTFSNITFESSAAAGFPKNGTATVTLPTGAVANTITITRTSNAWSKNISLLVKTGSTAIQTLTQPNTTTTINLTSANQKNTYTFSHNNAATNVAYVDNIKVNYTIPATPTTVTYITSCSTQTSYSVTSNLSHVTADDDNPITVSPDATDLNLFYTAENNTWNLPENITVTMGGTPLSDEDYMWDPTSGELLIGIENDFAFTGNIVVTINGWQQLATPTGLNSEYTSTSATLSWGEVANASSYLVTIVDGGDLSADIPNTQTSHTFEGLTPSTEYLWTVKAIGDGITYTNSEESETAEFTTLPAGYTITYNTNGGDAIPAASGTALPNPLPIPTKEHYEFQGWFTDEDCTQAATAGTTINADITLYAKWEAVTYTITLIPNYPNSLTGVFKDKEGNVIADNLVIPIKYGTESQLLTNFYSTLSLEGYQFDAFYTKVEGGQRRVRTGNLEEDLILYARWKQEYTITWNVLGAETGTTTIVEGQEWTLPEVDESCNDKQFVGWTTTPILEEQNEAPATLYTETNQFPLETNTYYAVFANVEVTGTGEYVKLTEALTDYSGEYLIVYEEGSRAFNGGLEESLLNGNDNYIPIAISDDVVQATDEVENARFIVAKVDGGYSIQSASGLYIGRSVNDNGMEIAQTYNENLVNTFPNCSTIQGKGGADIQYNNNTNPSQQNRFRYYASSLKTIALYKKTGTNMTNYTTSCVPTYTITWKNEDGTILETDENVENGATPSYDGETPTKAADAQYTYTFAGWTPEITTVTGDATYTATYTKTINKYTVTWKNEDGTTLETDENVQYGETPSYNGTTPTKAETAQYTYTFNAWTPAISTVTGDAIYTAKFDASINHYTVTFEMNGHGTAPATQTIAYGSKVSEPSAPTADGYEFAGWYKDEQCTIPWNFNTDIVTGNTTIHAKWLQIFTITWKANGLEYKTTNVTEGDLITPPDSPDLGDYCGQVFAGWTTAEMEETTNVAPTLYPNPTPFPTATEETPTTFYAVFADYDEQQ